MTPEDEQRLGEAMVAYERRMYAANKRKALPCDIRRLPKKSDVENYIRRMGKVRSSDVSFHFNCTVDYASQVISRCKALKSEPVPRSNNGSVYYYFPDDV